MAGEWMLFDVFASFGTVVETGWCCRRARGGPLPSALEALMIFRHRAVSSSIPSALGDKDGAAATRRRGWIPRVGRRDSLGSSVGHGRRVSCDG